MIKRCRLKVYFQRLDVAGYTAIGQIRCLTPVQPALLLSPQKRIFYDGFYRSYTKVVISAFATYNIYFYVIEWLNNENIPS